MIFRAPEPPVQIPGVPLTPLLERADARGDVPVAHRQMGERGRDSIRFPGRLRAGACAAPRA